jgi:hypothetical protein
VGSEERRSGGVSWDRTIRWGVSWRSLALPPARVDAFNGSRHHRGGHGVRADAEPITMLWPCSHPELADPAAAVFLNHRRGQHAVGYRHPPDRPEGVIGVCGRCPAVGRRPQDGCMQQVRLTVPNVLACCVFDPVAGLAGSPLPVLARRCGTRQPVALPGCARTRQAHLRGSWGGDREPCVVTPVLPRCSVVPLRTDGPVGRHPEDIEVKRPARHR